MGGHWFRSAQGKLAGLVGPQLRCSFCGRPAESVARLVAGASGHICDACVAQCVAILEKHGGGLAPAAR